MCDKPTEESSDSLINVDEQDTDNYENDVDDLGLITKEVHFDDCEPIQDESRHD